MSRTRAEAIAELEKNGKLYRFVPGSRNPPRRRTYLSAMANQDLNDARSAVNTNGNQGQIRAALTRWTLGERVYEGFLKRLKMPPPEIWEIKVTIPDIEVRLLGRFADPDTLILTKFYTRKFLGRFGSPNWISAMNNCSNTWNLLFGNDLPPFSGSTVSEYVTENCDDYKLK